MKPADVLTVALPDTLGIVKVHRHRAKMHLMSRDAVEVLGEGGDPRIMAPIMAVLADEAPDETETVEGDLVVEDPMVYHGNLNVTGNLDNRAVLVVTGELEVGGSYLEDGGELLVARSMSCEHLLAQGDVLVMGDLSVRGLVWVWDADHSLLVGGELAAATVVSEDHDTRYAKIAAGERLSAAPGQSDAALFAASVRIEQGVDRALVVERARAGKPVLAERSEAGPALPLRVVQLIDAVATSVSHEWTEVGGRPALRVVAEDGSRQISVLTPEEKAALETALAER